MLTTLWVMSVASVLAAAAALSGRLAVNAARNRITIERGEWEARGCMARARAAIDEDLASASSVDEAAIRWTSIDRDLRPFVDSAASTCSVFLDPAGARLDVNGATRESLARLFSALDLGERAESLADAVADWRDSDDVARPLGAERDWYLDNGRQPPPDTAFADIRELRLVRGFEADSLVVSDLSTDAGRISLANASIEVLMSIPGITRETAMAIVAAREQHGGLLDLASIGSSVPEFAAESLRDRFPDAVRASTSTPDAWIVTAAVERGLPQVSVGIRIRLVRVGSRTMVARVWSSE
ncbi:MAG TPA: hypothetical protein VHB25_19230 [Gemmatimonadaceae bacterium]|nr:hypothetical protein [Gemmatimonadaceae bacterium]